MADRRSSDTLMTPAEVAQMFRVNPKTVTRWASAGKLTAIRTLGGHRRFRRAEVLQHLAEGELDQLDPEALRHDESDQVLMYLRRGELRAQ